MLVISASMGAGHDGAARELAAQLRAGGHHAEVRDFLDSGPLRIGAALRSGYEFELKHLPSAYEATYRLWYRVPWLCPVVAWFVTALTRRRVLRWIRVSRAQVVVSTYPLATLCLGRLRAARRLAIPTINFITDFGVHPLWVHRGIDLNLAVHSGPAEMARRRTGRPSVACGPVVSGAFEPGRLPDREGARSRLGLAPTDRAVLVVAGSWGVGGVEATWRAITKDGRFTPVVVCGRDERLRHAVAALAESAACTSVVIGWTDEMPALMSACDALVENAGGLTSLEALRAGLPVASFRPIAGHGRENTAAMAAAGVSRLAGNPDELIGALDVLTSAGGPRDAQIDEGWAMFRTGVDTHVLDAAAAVPPIPLRRRPVVYIGRAAAAIVAIAALGWTGLTSGVEVAAASVGAGVAHPAAGATTVAYAGVRLNAQELADPAVATTLQRMHLTAVVDSATAEADPQAVRGLAALGVNVASGGQGDVQRHHGTWSDPSLTLWTRARDDATSGEYLEGVIGAPVTVLVPGRRVNAWDLIECSDTHNSLVVPNHVVDVQRAAELATPIHVTARRIYLINGLGATPAQLDAVLARLGAGLAQAHLTAVPFATLA